MATTTRTRPPTAADVAAAITALSAANAASGGTKQDRVTNLVTNAFLFAAGSILLALLFWVGSSITDLSKSVTLMSA
jgi:hypothetical protein